MSKEEEAKPMAEKAPAEVPAENKVAPKEIRTLKKVENGDFQLDIENPGPRLFIKQFFKKDQLKDTYENTLKPQEQGMLAQLNQVKKALKNVEEIENDEEVKKFNELTVKAAKLLQKEKLIQNRDNIEKELEKVRGHKKEIELAIPEVTRKK